MKHFDVISGSRSAAKAGGTVTKAAAAAAVVTAVEAATTTFPPARTKPVLVVAAWASSLSSDGMPGCFAAATSTAPDAADVATLCVLALT